MKRKIFRSIMPLFLLAAVLSVSALGVSLLQQQGAAKSATVSQTKQKPLKERAMERDVSVEGGIHPATEYRTFEALAKDAVAIVYGRVIDSKSFFDESGHPIGHGENITTEYTVEVYRVLRDRIMSSELPPDKAAPAPLTTPLKIARDGGVVYVNGHRAEVKYKGYESLKPGKQYVFFLFWSPDYQAYVLAGNISGVVMVNDDSSLKPLASSKEIQAELRNMDLESLIRQVQ
jgi:hypothetical protein